MSDSVNNQNFERNITRQDFVQLLTNSVMGSEQKEMVLSIFEQISGDNELSEEEWDNFIKGIDKNKDSKLTKNEFNRAYSNKSKRENVKTFYNLVKRFIENKFSVESQKEDGSTYAFCSADNGRVDSIGPGSFDKNWLLEDAYHSETYDDWLKNNGYAYNEETANKLYKNTAKYDYDHGRCAASVRRGLQETTAAGPASFIFDIVDADDYQNLNDKDKKQALKLLDKFDGRNPNYAYQYAEILSYNPYFKELPHNIVESMDLVNGLPKGCVVVYDAGYKAGNHPAGHISVTDGKGMDSGGGHYLMKNEVGKQETHIRVFVPVIVPPEPLYVEELKPKQLNEAEQIREPEQGLAFGLIHKPEPKPESEMASAAKQTPEHKSKKAPMQEIEEELNFGFIRKPDSYGLFAKLKPDWKSQST